MSPPTQRPLKKRTRALYGLVAVFLLISFLTLAFLYSNTVQSFVVRELISLAAERVGLDFEIESISIRVGSIEIRNASLYEPGVGPIIDLEYGSVEFEVLPLLQGQINIRHLRLDRPRVFIDYERGTQGRDSQFRIQRLRNMFRPDGYEPELRDERFVSGPSVSIGHVQIRSGTLVFDDNERALQLSDLSWGGASVRYGAGEVWVDPGMLSFELRAGSEPSHVRYSGDPVRLN
ncbi:MAG: hypothetical protein ABR590_07130, partial [Spirochaetia bacterium]